MSKQSDLLNLTDAISVSGSNVGIGTSSPATLLNISSNSSVAPVVFTITDTDNAVPNGQVLGGINFETSDTTNTGVSAQIEAVYENASGATAIGFRTGYAGALVDTMHLDFVGRVGIGTASPTNLLHLKDEGYQLKIEDTSSGNTGEVLVSDTSLYFFSDRSNAKANSDIRFSVDNTERMRIDSSGNVLVGTTSTAPNVGVGHAFTSAGGTTTKFDITSPNEIKIYNNNNGTGAAYVIQYRQNNISKGGITVGSSSTTYATTSDYRLKTDAQPMSGASERVLALKPVNFEWISSGERVDGFLAHEAQAVVPEAVTGTKDAMMDEEYEVTAAVLDADGMVVTEAVMGTRSVPDMQGIDQSKLVPLLTAALQEALTEISALKVRVAALEAN